MQHSQHARLISNHLAAASIGLILWRYRTDVADWAFTAFASLPHFVIGQLKWFATSKPAGVKLHIELSQLLSFIGIRYVHAWQNLLSATPKPLSLATVTGCAGLLLPILGLERFLIGTRVMIEVISIPLTLSYVAMALLWRAHVAGTDLTWLAMRGFRRLPILSALLTMPLPFGQCSRQIEDEDLEVANSSSHLAASALLFMPFLLLLPTTAWFYGFVCALHAVVTLLTTLLNRCAQGIGGKEDTSSWSEGLGNAALQYARGDVRVVNPGLLFRWVADLDRHLIKFPK